MPFEPDICKKCGERNPCECHRINVIFGDNNMCACGSSWPCGCPYGAIRIAENAFSRILQVIHDGNGHASTGTIAGIVSNAADVLLELKTSKYIPTESDFGRVVCDLERTNLL